MPASCRPTTISRPTRNSSRCSQATSLSHMPTPHRSSWTSGSNRVHRLERDLEGLLSGMDGIMGIVPPKDNEYICLSQLLCSRILFVILAEIRFFKVLT